MIRRPFCIMLRLENITKTYSGYGEKQTTALADVSLEFSSTGLVVVTGPSGCGKTTLLNILSGMDLPDSGRVVYKGRDTSTFSEDEWNCFRASVEGFVFQDYGLIENMTVKENLMLPLQLCGTEKAKAEMSVEEALKSMSMEELADKNVKHLSGGQKQRVAILRAIIKKPDIILADEPTGNLDRENSELVFRMLKLVSDSCLVIVVTHDEALAEAYADRVIRLSYGEVVRSDEKQKVVDEEGIVSEENICLHDRSARLRFANCMTIALGTLRSRKARMAMSIVMLTITMTLVLVAIALITKDKSKTIAGKLASEETQVIPLYEFVDDKFSNFKSGAEKTIKTGLVISETAEKCCGAENIIQMTYTEIACRDMPMTAMLIAPAPKAETGWMSIKAGRMPQKAGEFVIDEAGAKAMMLSVEDIPIMCRWGEVEASIVGVADLSLTKDCHMGVGVIFCDVSEWEEHKKANDANIRGIDVVATSGPMYQAGSNASIGKAETGYTKLIEGRWPEKPSEVVLSKGYLDGLGVVPADVLGKEFKCFDLREKKYGNAYNDVFNLYDYCGGTLLVTGIAEGDKDYYFLPEIYATIQKESGIYEEYTAAVISPSTLRKALRKIEKNGLRVDDDKLSIAYGLWDDMKSLYALLFAGILILGSLTVLQMVSLLSCSVKDNSDKIGLLRSLGVPMSDINKIFMFEGLTTVLSSVVLASVFVYIVIVRVNAYYANSALRGTGIQLICINVPWNLLAVVTIVLLGMMVVLLPLHGMQKKEIRKLLLRE